MVTAQFKPKIKAQSVKWIPEAKVFLLEWLEANKGPEGTLVQDEASALNALIADEHFLKLVPGIETLADDQKREKVTARLKWFWTQYRLSKYENAPYTATTIYGKGVEVLDWEEPGTRYVDLYTPDQLRARRRLAYSNEATSHATSKRKASYTVGGADDRQSPKRLRSRTNDAPTQPNDLTRTSPPESEQVGNRESSQGQREDHASAPRQPTDRLERRTRQNDMLSDVEFANLPKFKRLLGKADGGPSDFVRHGPDDVVEVEMLRIYDRIEGTVQKYMYSTKLDADQPILLEPKYAYPGQLNHLIGVVMGDSAGTVDARRMLFTSLQQEKAVG
ncbi:hypothetical protein EDD36DRAFT_419004 [Exophiala viscosa]|uniref:Uncharacterized protein n=1 Tax=Exophiala viscosa TaxID=2486360 RepID=A0AAN6DXT6_9EURO|nr:hypothetical protein EDD36DRAFT_419004 [Exophiala viscosa]